VLTLGLAYARAASIESASMRAMPDARNARGIDIDKYRDRKKSLCRSAFSYSHRRCARCDRSRACAPNFAKKAPRGL
jgi:phosphoribosyl-dephospho-CoA transferase